MSRPRTPNSMAKIPVTNENRPAWCSPGYIRNTMARAAKARPLTEAKLGNQTLPETKPQLQDLKAGKALARDVAQVDQDTAGGGTAETKGKRAGSPVTIAPKGQKTPKASSISRPKPTSATKRAPPVTEDTPPRSRPLKAPTIQVTPTNKPRKPVTSTVTPKANLLKGGTPPVISSKGFTPKGSSLGAGSARAREKSSRIANDSPSATRKVKERPSSTPQEGSRSGRSREKINQRSAWPSTAVGSGGGAVGRTVRRASPAQVRPPVKHLFLSPQGSKKTSVKRDAIRMSMESHALWASASNSKSRSSVGKQDSESKMPPPAQPSNSPEIPRRGSREASGEGICGYFGAGPMVAPDGLGGFVRDRRKCKPRGMLMVGGEGLSVDSDSSGAVESSSQIPLPSVASVEWMNKTIAVSSIIDIPSSCSSGKLKSITLSEYFMIHDNEAQDSAGLKGISDREVSGDGLFLHQLSQSMMKTKLKCDSADAQEFQQKQHSRMPKITGTQQRSRQSMRGKVSSDDDPICILKEEDITIHWPENLPYESIEMTGPTYSSDAVKDEHQQQLAGTGISFASSWVRPASTEKDCSSSEGVLKNRFLQNQQAANSLWYGFSPNTPDFLQGSSSEAIDASMAVESVRRRIITDRSLSPKKTSRSSTSLAESMQLVGGDNSSSCGGSPCALRSLDASSSFQFTAMDVNTARSSFSPSKYLNAAMVAENASECNMVCRNLSPAKQSSYGEDLLCQTASPIEKVCYDSSADRPNIDNDVEAYSLDCSVACSIDECDGGCSSGDCTVDIGDVVGCLDDDRQDDSEDDEVEYASPVTGDYLSLQKPPSPSVKLEKSAIGPTERSNEFGHPVVLLKGAGGRRSSICRSSISRTLEELMRHNFSL